MGLDGKVGDQILWGLQKAEGLVNLQRVEARDLGEDTKAPAILSQVA